LQIEKEELVTQLRNLSVALKQEQNDCLAAQKRTVKLAAQLKCVGST
jgi:hypothetical protein